jgi:hypothetical protein
MLPRLKGGFSFGVFPSLGGGRQRPCPRRTAGHRRGGQETGTRPRTRTLTGPCFPSDGRNGNFCEKTRQRRVRPGVSSFPYGLGEASSHAARGRTKRRSAPNASQRPLGACDHPWADRTGMRPRPSLPSFLVACPSGEDIFPNGGLPSSGDFFPSTACRPVRTSLCQRPVYGSSRGRRSARSGSGRYEAYESCKAWRERREARAPSRSRMACKTSEWCLT